MFILMVFTAIFSSELRGIYVLYALIFAFGLSVGIFLWSKAHFAVTYAKLYFVLQPFLLYFLIQIAVQRDQSFAAGGLAPYVDSIASIAWFCYLTYSKRVQTTYDLNKDKRSLLLATVMGAFLGPFGTIYFHIRVFIAAVVGSIIALVMAVLTCLILRLSLPSWMSFVWLGFYAIANLIMAIQWNDNVQSGEDETGEWQTALLSGVTLGVWAFRVMGISTAIYTAIQFFTFGKVFWGIVVLLVVPWAFSVPAKWIMSIIALLAGLVVSIGSKRRTEQI